MASLPGAATGTTAGDPRPRGTTVGSVPHAEQSTAPSGMGDEQVGQRTVVSGLSPVRRLPDGSIGLVLASLLFVVLAGPGAQPLPARSAFMGPGTASPSGNLPSASSTPRLAVFVLGPDVAAVGTLQASIESELGRVEGLVLVPGAEVGLRLGHRTVPGTVVAPERARIAAALERVRVAYYEDRAADARAALAEAEVIDAGSALVLPASSRIEVHLWRAALVLLSGNDRDAAGSHARNALVLDPRLQVDLQRFPSELKDLVDAVRKQGLPGASVRVEGLPPGARFSIDDRPLAGPAFSVAPGFHVLAASAPGRRAVRVLLEIRVGEQTITLRLPTGADDALTADLGALVAAPAGMNERKNERKNGGGDALLATAGVDGLVIVHESRAVVVWRGAAANRIDAADGEALPKAVAAQVENDLVRERDLAVGRRAPRRGPGWEVEAGSRLALASRLRRVRSDEATYSSGVAGVGPVLALSARSSRLLVEGDVSLVSFQANRYAVTTRRGGTASVRAGTLTVLRASAGGRLPIGAGDTILELAVGGVHEITREDSLAGAEGFNPSSTRTAIELRGGARAPFGESGRIDAGMSLGPWSRWTETPSGATGRSPRPLPSLGAWAGADWKLGSRWRAGIAWRGEVRAVQFSGDAAIPVDPPVSGARLDETIHTVNASASREF